MDSDLMSIISLQVRCFNLKTYKNEFETMSILFDDKPQRRFIRDASISWLRTIENNEDMEYALKEDQEKIQESKDLRQQGNVLFTAKGSARNVLAACRLYNDAIYAALDTKGEELALGFANRATALQTFGYYQQAYDDCICALKLGYPEAMKHKVIERQTYCSLQMKDLPKVEKHLNELEKLNVNKLFQKELIKKYENLKKEMTDNKHEAKEQIVPLNRESQEIVNSENGRIMLATRTIEKNELIFTERATAFVPVVGGSARRLCQQCGTLNIIPIPCLNCRGRVNYCSLKCQNEHSSIHMYECPGYRFQLFTHIGIAHLALRIILDNGLFSIIEYMKLDSNKYSTQQIWSQLIEGGDIWKNTDIPYAENLRMLTHLDKMSIMDIQWFALVARILVVYLRNYTKYFENLEAINSNINWELLTGSLILRHIGQCIVNSHTLTTIIPKCDTLLTTTDFHMLNENIWASPWHLKSGYLLYFFNYEDVVCSNFPYLSLCNHSCIQSFQPKISGRYVSTFALRKLNKGDEITNYYYIDYRKSKHQPRHEKLQENFHFVCQCQNCRLTDNHDKEFNKFHQYRCDNRKCQQIFIPNIPNKPTLNWWQTDTPHGKLDVNFNCTICGEQQKLKWYHDFKHWMGTMMSAQSRQHLYKIFKNSSKNLIGLNDARSYLATKITLEFLKFPWINIPLSDNDYVNLIDMAKYVLNVTKAECCVNSIEYVTQMILLWELMVKRKYKCTKAEMDEMLWALTITDDDTKEIFLNYYNDYIKDYINS